MRQYEKKSNIGFFLFWVCLLAMLGLLSYYFILFFRTGNIPSFKISESTSTQMEDNKESRDNNSPSNTGQNINIDIDINTKDDNLDEEIKVETPPNDNTDDDMDDEMRLGANAPLFIAGEIAPIGEFRNERGTEFTAGMLYFTGTYPQDFEQKNKGPKVVLDITLSFGWSNLPTFSEIETKLQEESSSVVLIDLPPLALLDLQIKTEEMDISTHTFNVIKETVDTYIHGLFKEQDIPSSIMDMARLRLSSAYLQRKYKNIELVPINQ